MTILAIGIVLYPLLHSWEDTKKPLIMCVFILIAFPLFSLTVYYFAGSSNRLEKYWILKSEAAIVKKELAKIKNPSQIILKLKHFLGQQPNHPKGWYLLGRLYLGMKKYSQAVTSLEKAYQLKPNNHSYAVAYSEALFFQHHQKLSPKALIILNKVIQQDPFNVAAINLLAINSYLEKNYQTAIGDWKKLLSKLPSNSADKQMLLSMIQQAQRHLANHKE